MLQGTKQLGLEAQLDLVIDFSSRKWLAENHYRVTTLYRGEQKIKLRNPPQQMFNVWSQPRQHILIASNSFITGPIGLRILDTLARVSEWFSKNDFH